MDKQQIIEKANEILVSATKIHENIDGLLSPKHMGILEIWDVLTALIRSAESVYAGISGAGEEKHTLVKEIWTELDVKYKLVDKIDKAIKLPIWAEPFDAKVIRFGIDQFINAIVRALNQTGVFRH